MNSIIKEVRNEFLQLFDKFLINKHKLISKISNFHVFGRKGLSRSGTSE